MPKTFPVSRNARSSKRLIHLAALLPLGVFLSACSSNTPAPQKESAPTPQALSLSIVSPSGDIEMSDLQPRAFYVILTNNSAAVQTIFHSWSSWGDQAISFRIVTPDGTVHSVTKKPGDFTKNTPSTFTIKPAEHQVFPIRFDQSWDAQPPLPKRDETPITLHAIYEVAPTPESTQYNVWTNRIESRPYSLPLGHW
jgi:hypothetical protein